MLIPFFVKDDAHNISHRRGANPSSLSCLGIICFFYSLGEIETIHRHRGEEGFSAFPTKAAKREIIIEKGRKGTVGTLVSCTACQM